MVKGGAVLGADYPHNIRKEAYEMINSTIGLFIKKPINPFRVIILIMEDLTVEKIIEIHDILIDGFGGTPGNPVPGNA